MLKLNTLLGLLFFVFYWAIPLSIGQEIRDTSIERIGLLNASFEKADKTGEPNGWENCNFSQSLPPNNCTDLRLLSSGQRGGHHKAFDQLLAYFEQSDNYKLIIRVKNGKELSKQRIGFLYSYIFRNTNLKAQRVEIKQFTPKDETYFWTFENDELAISFDSM